MSLLFVEFNLEKTKAHHSPSRIAVLIALVCEACKRLRKFVIFEYFKPDKNFWYRTLTNKKSVWTSTLLLFHSNICVNLAFLSICAVIIILNRKLRVNMEPSSMGREERVANPAGVIIHPPGVIIYPLPWGNYSSSGSYYMVPCSYVVYYTTQ